jgi:hypothetical protein
LAEGAELRQALGVVEGVDVVVYQPDRVEADLGVLLETLGQPLGDHP